MVLHFLIQGRVQGVGFRWFVHREASELELRGWVRNTEDGDVEVGRRGRWPIWLNCAPACARDRAAAAWIAWSNTSSTMLKQKVSIRSELTGHGNDRWDRWASVLEARTFAARLPRN